MLQLGFVVCSTKVDSPLQLIPVVQLVLSLDVGVRVNEEEDDDVDDDDAGDAQWRC